MRPLLTLSSTPLYRDGLGTPVFGPLALVRDLELRLGHRATECSPLSRTLAYTERLRALAPPMLSRSFEADSLGTAEVLLAVRDALVDAGWNGEVIPHGGPRLEAIAQLEALGGPPLPMGLSDRWVSLEQTVTAGHVYEELQVLPEELLLWPRRWRKVLEAAGPLEPIPGIDDGAADEDTDLRRLQRGEVSAPRADGSVQLIWAETSLEVAEAVPDALEASANPLVVRGGDHATLDLALQLRGQPPLGTLAGNVSVRRQWLLLSLELLFEPRDARLAMDLLLLPGGPIRRDVGRRLAEVLARRPVAGGPHWAAELAALAEEESVGAEALAAIADWIPVGKGQEDACAVDTLRAHLSRIRELTDDLLLQQDCEALERAIALLPRTHLRRFELRRCLALARADHSSASFSAAGRVEHVDDPGLALRAADHVVWWSFTEPVLARDLWRDSERRALSAAGLPLPDRSAVFAARARGWWRPILAARNRLTLVLPRSSRGERRPIHPLWDELVVRTGGDPEKLWAAWARPAQARQPRPRAALPPPRTTWRVPAPLLTPEHHSPKSLESLISCPLQWALVHRGRLVRYPVATMPGFAQVEGDLGHRLVEELVREGHLAQSQTRIAELLDRLIDEEALHLRLPGRSYELESLRRMLLGGIAALADWAQANGLTALRAEVELPEDPERSPPLRGRADLVGVDDFDQTWVLDLKRRGANSLRERLQQGRAVQLAVYGEAFAARTAYFSLTSGTALSTDPGPAERTQRIEGPRSLETGERLWETVRALQQLLDQGEVLATGVEGAPDLVERLASSNELLPDLTRRRVAGEVCDACAAKPICGKAWEPRS